MENSFNNIIVLYDDEWQELPLLTPEYLTENNLW
jgi:hypothetical protein